MITQTFSQTRHPGSGILITDSRSLLHLATALGTVASSGTAAVPRPSEAAPARPRSKRPHLARRGARATVPSHEQSRSAVSKPLASATHPAAEATLTRRFAATRNGGDSSVPTPTLSMSPLVWWGFGAGPPLGESPA